MEVQSILITPQDQYQDQPIIKEIDCWKDEINKHHLLAKDGFPEFGRILDDFRQFCIEYLSQSDAKNCEAVNVVLFEYWEPIRYAIMQHRAMTYRPLLAEGYTKIKEFTQVLENELGIKIASEQEVLTILYFEKTGKAKKYPFRGVNLVGSPLPDAYGRLWMSIPHELGHLVYWNAKFNDMGKKSFFDPHIDTSVENLTDEKEKIKIQQLLADWSEEIFADIIGAKIAGNQFAESAWNRVVKLNKTAEDLFRNDGEHPIPYITPYISHFIANDNAPFDETKWTIFKLEEYRYKQSVIALQDTVEIRLDSKKLLECVKTFVNSVNSDLSKIAFDPRPITEKETAFASLKNFLFRKEDLTQEKFQEKFQESLLKPKILDRGENWRCYICGTLISSNTVFCTNCHLPTRILSIFA